MTIPVYCLAGRSENPRMRNDHLGGQLFRPPYRRIDILYPNRYVILSNIDIAVAKVATLAAKPGRAIFFGHSAGARALARYLRTDPDISDKVFVLTGNQERKYGGASVVGPLPADYGGLGVPEDTPHQVWDFARQYDAVADYPDEPNLTSLTNIIASATEAGGNIHVDYSTVWLGDPSNLTVTEGNIHYVLAPTWPAPVARKRTKSVAWEAIEDNKKRPLVEKCYSRPFAPIPRQRSKKYAGGVIYDSATLRFSKPTPPPWSPW